MTAGKVHVETQGAQAYIDSFEDDLDNGDSIPTDDEDPIDTDTGTDIPQDTISIDGIIDSVYVNPNTGDIIVLTDDGSEITIDPETLESEDGSVLLTDSAGNSWTVDGDGNVSGGGTGTTSSTTESDSLILKQETVLVEALEYFKEEVELWLDNSEKGPLSNGILNRMENLPDCLPQDATQLDSVLVKINYYIKHPSELLSLLKKDDFNKTFIENLVAHLSGIPPYRQGLTKDEWEQLITMICPYLVEEESVSELVVVYNNRIYKNNESIYVFGETNEIVLEAASEETLEGLSWEGAAGNGLNATVDLSAVGEEGIEINANTSAKSTTVKVVKVKSMVKVTSVDKYFAPTVENLDIAYEVKSDTLKHAKIEIFKNGDNQNPIYMDTTIAKTGTDLKISWDGKMNTGTDKGKYITVFDSPYTVKISVTFDSLATYSEGFNDIDETKVEIESLTLTPNGKEILYKPNRTAVEIDKDIEAQVLIKNKQKNGVPTALPFTVHWSFEDPDDLSSNRNIDLSGSSGNDNTLIANGGKSGASSVMWKPQSGFVSNINYTTAESDVSIHGQDLAKAKIKFSSSVIAGDNYILVAQIKDVNGTIIEEEKTQEWIVRKRVSFTKIYQMSGGLNMGNIMRVSNIDPAYSNNDGCTDYSVGTVTNLASGVNSPEFVAALLPPIPLVDPATGLPDPNTELPTAQELQDYASSNPAVSGPAQVAITAKAQRWFNRNMANLRPSLNNLVNQIGITAPAIIGARYYHPKLDGRSNPTNYYPAGIIIQASGDPSRYSKLVDPDDDWREVQGVADSQGNPWVFSNTVASQRQQVVGRHEVGHVSDHVQFGATSDHATKGLMHPNGDISSTNPYGVPDFSDHSLNKLRGRN